MIDFRLSLRGPGHMRKIRFRILRITYLSHQLYPRAIKTSIDISGRSYVEEGVGDPVVLLYGLFGSVKNFSCLIDHLKKEHRVIVPVFPFYESGISVDIYTLTGFLEGVMDELQLEKFHLLGNSMGGHI